MLRIRRSARVRAAVESVDLLAPARTEFEALERRVMMCASIEELVAKGIPESMIDAGHVLRSDYDTLSPELKEHIDPHWVQDDPNDNLYVEPGKTATYMSLEEVRAAAGRGSLVEALPDFFPLMYTSASIDSTSQTGRTLLRFGTQVNNQGLGPGCFISRDAGAAMPTDAPIVDPITSWINPDGSQNVLQKVFSWNATSQNYTPMYYRAAGKVMYHSGHGHLHYDGYAGYRLRYRLPNGQPGDYVERTDGTGVIGAKVGFCLLTFSGTFTTESGVSSSTLPGYNRDSTDSNGATVPQNCGYNQGVRVGHYDQYSSGLEGQWLDVTGVPAGQYFVEITMDDSNMMSETNESNNAKSFAVTVPSNTPGGIPADVFDSGGINNNSWDDATDMGEMGIFTQTGLTVHWGFDKDFFNFVAASTGTGTIATTASSGNIDLYLYDSHGGLLKQSTLTSGTDTVSWNFEKGELYYIKAETYNSTLSSNYQIAWNIKPTVGYTSPDTGASEIGPNVGTFTVSRNGPVSGPVTIPLTIGGNAIRNVDYVLSSPDATLVGNNLTIGTLASQATLIVTPIQDNLVESTETVTLAIASGSTFVSGGGLQTIFISDRLVPRPPLGPTPPLNITFGGFGDRPIVARDGTDRIDDDLLAF